MGNIFNNILAIVGLFILAGLGYYLFVLEDSSELSGSGAVSVNEAELANQQFLRQIQELKDNELSDDIFNDERFVSFVDFSLPLTESETGRTNPFEPAE